MFIRLLKIIFVLPLDLCVGAVLLAGVGAAVLLGLHRPRPNAPTGILHLSNAGSVEQVLRKFGSLDFLFASDQFATEGVFDRDVLFWFPSQSALRMELGRWVLVERRLKLTLCTHLALFSLQLLRESRRTRLQVVRAWNPFHTGLFGLIVARVLGVPLLVSLHTDYHKRHELDGARGSVEIFGSFAMSCRLASYVLRRADLVLPIRASLGRQAVEQGADPARIRLFPHGMDLQRVPEQGAQERLAASLGLEPGQRILSFVGRLTRENYVDDVLELGRRLFSRHPELRLVLAGGGVEENRLRRTVAEDAALSGRVLLPGYLSNAEALTLRSMSAVNLCLMGGFSLIEACASGRPVLSYDVEWHAELITDGVSGYLLPQGDMDGLERRAVSLLADAALADRLGENARQAALRLHASDNVAKIKRQVYAEALRLGAAGRRAP